MSLNAAVAGTGAVEQMAAPRNFVAWTDAPDPREILAESDPEIYEAIELERKRQIERRLS